MSWLGIRQDVHACVFFSHSDSGLRQDNGPLARYGKLRLLMRRECRKLLSRHWLQSKPLVSDPGMHHGTCVTHVPWCMSGSLTHRGGENVPGISGACATRNFTYLVRGPCPRLLPKCLKSCLLPVSSSSWEQKRPVLIQTKIPPPEWHKLGQN